MDKTPKIIIITIIISLILAISLTVLIDNRNKDTEFNLKKSENFRINVRNEYAQNLRFKNCIVTLISTDNDVATKNVTNNLNLMLDNSKEQNMPELFKLSMSGLNAYSFVIDGVSDVNTITKNHKIADKWMNGDITLHGYYYFE